MRTMSKKIKQTHLMSELPNTLKYVGFGLLAFVGFVLLFGIPTALIPTPWFSRMIPARTLDYVFLLLNSGLIGAYIGVHAYEKHERSKRGDVLATTASLTNILAVGCPICNKILVALIGASAIMTYIEPARVWFGIVSAGLVGVALFLKIKNLRSCVSCKRVVSV